MLSSIITTINILQLLSVAAALYPQLPVCVIGAGPSGISMGRLLDSHKINYRMFEAESRVGGKAYTWRDAQNVGVEMGAFFFTKREKYINQAVQDAGLNLKQFDGSVIDIYNQDGKSIQLPDATAEQKVQFIDAVNRYTSIRDRYNLTVGYINVPAEAQVSLQQWLINNNLKALAALFIPYVTVQGYGSLDEIPAIYIIKMFDLKGLTSLHDFANALHTVEAGQDTLWGNLSKDLNLSLNHKVTKIVRTNRRTGLEIIKLQFQNQGIDPVLCSHVMVAFPPNFNKIQTIFSDLDTNEADIIPQIRNNYYTTTVVENVENNWQVSTLLNVLSPKNQFPVEPIGRGEAVGFLKQTKYYSAYSWYKGTYLGTPPQNVLDLVNTELESLLTKLDEQRNSVTRPGFQISFEYFPHVAVDSIKQGFFEKFDTLQGNRNTYFLTTALSFETMNQAIEMAQSVFFTKLLPKLNI